MGCAQDLSTLDCMRRTSAFQTVKDDSCIKTLA